MHYSFLIKNNMSFLEKLQWRYATKKFDTTKPISEADKSKILEAIQFAPTSFGFQPFHVEIVESKDIREELKSHAWGQGQVTDAPLFLVFTVRTDLVERVNEFLDLMTGKDAEKRAAMAQYEEMMKGAVSGKTEDESKAWAAKQTYIALGFGLAAAAELGLDSCPMEGFDAGAFKKILGLADNLSPVVLLTVGYRAADDAAAARPKVRFPKEELFSTK